MPEKAILIMLDACRPDAIARADTPALDGLTKDGAYTWQAQAVWPSYTLACHMSLFRGVPPHQHGVMENTAVPQAYGYPSIMDVAHQAGRHTAMFYSWEELRDLSAPGSVDMSYCRTYGYNNEDIDTVIARTAAEYIVQASPDLVFVYFAKPDLVGHVNGWMSNAYLESVQDTDRAISQLLTPIREASMLADYTVIVLADHGGHDHDHGSDSPEDMTIPWIIMGDGIKKGHVIQSPVTIFDTAATLAHTMHLPIPATWAGKPVQDVFGRGDR